MASLMKRMKRRRQLRNKNKGKERKRVNRNKGTTPSFPIHPERKKVRGQSEEVKKAKPSQS